MGSKISALVERVKQSPTTSIVLWCTGVVGLWRLCLELINQALVPYLTPPVYAASRDLPNPHVWAGLLRWMNWDGQWYKTIIEHGYIVRHHLQAGETIAFFPFFPFMVKWLSALMHISYKIIGFGLNACFLIATVVFLYKLTIFLMDANSAKKDFAGKIAVCAFLLSPAAFFLATFYVEPLLVLCFTAGIYYALKQKYYIAVVFSAVAGASKIDGIVIAMVVLTLYVQRNYDVSLSLWRNTLKHMAKIIALGLIGVSGLMAYLLYLWHRFGTPLASLENQKYWDRHAGNFLVNLWTSEYSHIGSIYYFGNKINYIYHIYLMALPIAVILGLLYALRWKKQMWLSVFTVIMILLPILSGTLMSLNRVFIVLTPLLACVVAAIVQRNNCHIKYLGVGVLSLSAVLLMIFTTAFLGVYFVG